MARYRGPVGKVSRRLGIGISEKGQRILNKRAFPPGHSELPEPIHRERDGLGKVREVVVTES